MTPFWHGETFSGKKSKFSAGLLQLIITERKIQKRRRIVYQVFGKFLQPHSIVKGAEIALT